MLVLDQKFVRFINENYENCIISQIWYSTIKSININPTKKTKDGQKGFRKDPVNARNINHSVCNLTHLVAPPSFATFEKALSLSSLLG